MYSVNSHPKNYIKLPLHSGLNDLQGTIEDLQDVLHQPKSRLRLSLWSYEHLLFRLFLEALISKFLGHEIKLIHGNRNHQS